MFGSNLCRNLDEKVSILRPGKRIKECSAATLGFLRTNLNFEFQLRKLTRVDQQAFPFVLFLRRIYRDIGSRPSLLAGRRWDLTDLWGELYLDVPLKGSLRALRAEDRRTDD